MHGWSPHDIALAMTYIFMGLLAPAAFRLGRLTVRYVYHRYFSSEDIYVTYQEKGVVTYRYKIERRKNGSIIRTDLTSGKRTAHHE